MFNRTVTKHSTGIKTPHKDFHVSESVLGRQNLESRILTENANMIDESIARKEESSKRRELDQKIEVGYALENQIPRVINKVNDEGKNIILLDIMFEAFKRSLYLDKEFVYEHEDNLRGVVNKYITENGGYGMIVNAYKRTQSPILKKIMTVCEATAAKVAKRKMEECQKGEIAIDDISFDVTPDEKLELDYDKEKLDIDTISALVKNKVLTVIKDEKQRQQREEEISNEIQAQADEEGITVKEAYQKYVITDVIAEESTLFNSIFRRTYKSAMESAVTAIKESQLDEEGNPIKSDDDEKVNWDEMDLSDNEHKDFVPKVAKMGEYRYDIEVDDYRLDRDLSVSDDFHIDMDLVLAESITHYTLMEVMYTMRVEDFRVADIQQISRRLLS